jgi:predicted dehydrogenase
VRVSELRAAYPPVADPSQSIASPGPRTILSPAIHRLPPAHVLGAAPYGSPFRLHIAGAEGQLSLETDGMPQIAPPTLKGARGPNAPEVMPIPAAYLPPSAGLLQGPAVAMASAYAALPDDLSSGAAPLPDFEHALKMHRLLDAIKTSSRTGVRQTLQLDISSG